MSDSDNPTPARNMADIARLFMEGVRPAPGGEAPKRLGPRDCGHEPSAKKSPPATVMMGLALPAQNARNWKLLQAAATGLAREYQTTIGLIGLTRPGELAIEVAGPAQKMAATPACHGTPADIQIARILHGIGQRITLWLVAAQPTDQIAFPAVASIVRHWLLACPTDNDGLIAAYQHLKRAVGTMQGDSVGMGSGGGSGGGSGNENNCDPSVYLFAEDEETAARVHGRLRQAAREFLHRDLRLAGSGPVREANLMRLATIPVEGVQPELLWAGILDELCPAAEGETAEQPATASRTPPPATPIEALLEEVTTQASAVAESSAAAHDAFDHLAQVLDPEERQALSAELDPDPDMPEETPEPPSPPTAQAGPIPKPQEPVIAPQTGVPLAESGGDRADGLRAFDFLAEEAGDLAAQWQVVERAVRDLSLDCVLLEARAPMAWARFSALAVDARGRLHVWMLHRDGAAWHGLREWAREQLDLLALTRRDLMFDREAEITVHLVLPLDAGQEPALRAMGGAVRVYRLHWIQWNGRRGVIVAPAD